MVQENNPISKTKDELAALLKGSIKNFNKFREESNFEEIDLSEVQLQGATLTGAKLNNINFTGVNLEYANLVGSDLSGANLSNALLTYSNLSQTIFSNGNLTGADFTGSQLENAIMDGADLSMALFSQASFVNVSVDGTNFESTNFCSANLSDTNFKNAKNIQYCIFDKFTRWPAEQYLPNDFNPARGMYGSDEDFSINVSDQQEQQSSYESASQPQDPYYDSSTSSYAEETLYSQDSSMLPDYSVPASDAPMSADEFRAQFVDEFDYATSEGDFQELEKRQILLDRKLDYVIATVKVLTEKVVEITEKGGGGAGDPDGYDSFEDPQSSGGSVNIKLQELDDKIENVAGILTRFPVKSLEETYKLTDVITRIESTQNDLNGKLNQSLHSINKAHEEINSILGGKLKASYIDGLDKMFEDTIVKMNERLNVVKQEIVDQAAQSQLDLDESAIVAALQEQFKETANVLRQDIERKLGTHGLFLKQMDERIAQFEERTDVGSLINQLRDDIDYKLGQVGDASDRLSEKQDNIVSELQTRISTVDTKIDILSQTHNLNSISSLIAEFGAGFSSELTQVKEAAIAIENRLKGLTGEVDLSTDFAIDSIAKAVNTNLAGNISEALASAQSPESLLMDVTQSLNQKIDLMNQSFDEKLKEIETRMVESFQSAGDMAPESSIASDLEELKNISSSLAAQMEEIKNYEPDRDLDTIKEAMQEKMQDIIAQSRELSQADASISNRAEQLEQMSQIIANKLDSFYKNFDERSDVLEDKVDDIAETELDSLMSDLSSELMGLKDSVSDLDVNTRESIRVQGVSSQEVINSLREDLALSVDEVLKSIKTMEKDELIQKEENKLSNIKDDLQEKAGAMKDISDRISGKMENLFENLNKKTAMLEEKVDILAHAETDTADIMNELLAELEEDINEEIGSLKGMLSQVENRLLDPSFTELSSEALAKSLMERLGTKMETAVDKTNDAIVKKISGDLSGEPSATITGDAGEELPVDAISEIAQIKDIVTEIRQQLPSFSAETIQRIDHISQNIDQKLEALEFAVVNKTGEIQDVVNEIVKEASMLPAASKSFDISDDLSALKDIATTLDTQMKQAETLQHEPTAMTKFAEMKQTLDAVSENVGTLSAELDIPDLEDKVSSLRNLGDKIANKMNEVASEIGDNIDLSDKLEEAYEAETAELLDEFSAELSDLKEFIHSTDTLMRDSIKSSSMLAEDSMNQLREDLSASLDSLSAAIEENEDGKASLDLERTSPEDLKKLLESVTLQADKLSEDASLAEKTKLLQDLGDRLSNKLDSVANDLSANLDFSGQLEEVYETETCELLEEFSSELSELKEYIHSADSLTRDSIQASTALAEESIHQLREDIAASLDSMTNAITGIEDGTYPFTPTVESVKVEESIDSKKNLMKDISDKISEKIGSLLETVENKADVLEQKVDILAQSDTDNQDMISEMFLEFKEEILSELGVKSSLSEDSGAIEMPDKNIFLAKVDDISREIMDVNRRLEEMKEVIGMADKPEDAIEAGELTQILEKVKYIEENLEQGLPEKLSESVKDVLSEANISQSQVEVMDMITSVNDQISALRNITEDVNNNIIKLDETTIQNVVNKVEELVENGVEFDTDVLIEAIRAELEQKIANLNIGETISNTYSEVSHKIEKIYEDLFDLSFTLENKLEELSRQNPKDDLTAIQDAISHLNNTSEAIKGKLNTISEDDTLDKLAGMVVDIESSVSREVEFLRNTADTINESFKDFSTSIDTSEIEDNLNNLVQFNKDVVTKLDSLMAATGDINSDALVDRIKEHIEERVSHLLDQDIGIENILENLGSDISNKLNDIIVQNDELEKKITNFSKDSQLDNIMAEVHTLKTTAFNLDEKLQAILEDVKSVETLEHMSELQKEIISKVEMISDALGSEDIMNSINLIMNDFYTGIMEKTEELERKLDSVDHDILAEGIDIVTTDISLLREVTESITEKVERLASNTEGLQTEESLNIFREQLELKLNALLESEQSIDIESILSGMSSSLHTKMDEYFDTSRTYISDVLSTLEENLVSAVAESKEVSISEFADSADEKIGIIREAISEMNAKMDLIQEYSETTLVTKEDIQDVFLNINSITDALQNKATGILTKVEKQLDASGLSNVKVLRREMEKRMEALAETTDDIKSKLDSNFDEAFTDKMKLLTGNLLNKFDQISGKILSESEKIEQKMSAFNSDDIIAQIDGLVSDVLVELDKEVSRISQLVGKIDTNMVNVDKGVRFLHKANTDIDGKMAFFVEKVGQLDNNVSVVDNKVDNILGITANLEGKLHTVPGNIKGDKQTTHGAVETLVQFMQKDADQKLMLMKELIGASSGKPRGGYLEQRIKMLEEHIAQDRGAHNEKVQNVLQTVKALLEDIEGTSK